ncbi:MAG: 3-isopropylmalate dehydrogenase [Selenomonadales bacterium]|nr:3-isopropylmalate dehydrogenase [Selenomonadales bacterium]
MKQIVVIPGDGIGREITDAAILVLKKAAAKHNIELAFSEYDAGGAAIDKFGEPLPQATIDAAKAADAVLLGAVGGPKWDSVAPHLRPERAILGLRKALGLFANLRPISVPASLAEYSPLKPELVSGAGILIVRELTGGIYFGEKFEAQEVDGVMTAWDKEYYTRPEIERIVELACQAAQKRKGKVTSVDKSNVLASSRLWRKTAHEVAEKYPDVELGDMYVDNAAMQLASNPKGFDVLVTSNLFGDILSDEAAVIGGSIGMMPSASMGKGTGLYEPIHGNAPDIAGMGIANPVGTILSAAMMLRYSLDENEAAETIEQAVEAVLADGYRTADLYREGMKKASTMEMAEAIAAKI